MKRNLYVMYAISFFQGMVFYASVATLYRQAAGLSVFEISMTESVCTALMLLLELPWGVAADRIGYRRTLIICNALYLVSKLVFWRAAGLAAFLTERVLLAVVLSGLSGVDSSVLYLSAGGQSQRAFGLYGAMSTAGALLSATVCAVAVGENYRLAGLLTVFSYGAAALLTFGLCEVKPQAREARPSWRRSLGVLRETLRNRRLLLLALSFALLGEAVHWVTVFLGQLQYARAGIPVRLIAALFLPATLCELAGVLSDPLTRRIGGRALGAAAFTVCGGACLLLAATESAGLSVGCVLLMTACGRLAAPLGEKLQNDAVLSGDRATALSMAALAGEGLSVLLDLAFGALAQRNLGAAMGLGALLCALGAAAFARAARLKRARMG